MFVTSGSFNDVQSDFSAKVPSVYFSLAQHDGVRVQIGINNSPAGRTSKLLAVYTALEPRVAMLGVAFRQWAHVRERETYPTC